MANSFAATVGDWCRTVPEAIEVVFRESAEELVRVMDMLLVESVYDRAPARSGYKRTGFLRASLVASTTAMPMLTRDNPGVPVPADLGDVVLVIEGLELGQTLYVGFTARYAAFVHYSGDAAPWVDLAAQRWSSIVTAKSAEVRARLGL
jgi:hypothetical protein